MGKIIGGFNPQTYDDGKSIVPNSGNSTNSLGNFAITIGSGVFTSNGLKTLEIYTTDDAGAVSNKITDSFTLNVSGISSPTTPTAPDDTNVEFGYHDAGIHKQSHAGIHWHNDGRCDS